jgi:presequence protease
MQLTETPLASSPPLAYSTFAFKRSRFLPTLNLSVEEYEHSTTGAVHFHLASDNPENVFLVALRTVPHSGAHSALRQSAFPGTRSVLHDDPPLAQHLYECLYQQRLDRLPLCQPEP